MQLIHDLTETRLAQESILTIGAFDGIHRGHQALVCGVIQQARATGRLSGVITFHPHPANVLSPAHGVRYITTPAEKAMLLERLGIDVMALLTFTPALADQPAEVFVGTLAEHLRPAEIWIGQDFALGRHREGDPDALRALGQRWGFSVRQLEPVSWNGEIVSSSRIRRLLAAGELEQVADLLGWYYALTGRVEHGHQRGRTLGFPTANIRVSNERALPRDGVYACFALLGKERAPAVANLGVRPMFHAGGERLLEVHLLDRQVDLYERDLTVELTRWLRPELKFASVDALIKQMHLDVEQARESLRQIRPAPLAICSAWDALRYQK
jgi:riboflavin kinase/FMN adenylyltransferase